MLYGNMTLVELTLEPEAFVLFFNSLALLALLAAGLAGPLWGAEAAVSSGP